MSSGSAGLRGANVRLALVRRPIALAACLAAAVPAGAALPDILGVRPGMAPREAYEILKGVDPARSVALEQVTLPELYGEQPVTFAMAPATTGGYDQIRVSLTLPPSPQQVWQVHRLLINLAARLDDLVGALRQKYGDTPFNAGRGDHPTLDWFFDAQGQAVRPTDPQGSLALKQCMAAQLQPFNVTPTGPAAGVIRGTAHATPLQFPAAFDPAVHPQCQNLIWVHAVAGAGGNPSLEVSISDYTLQHRTARAYAEAVNGVVTHGRQGAQKQQQGAPKL